MYNMHACAYSRIVIDLELSLSNCGIGGAPAARSWDRGVRVRRCAPAWPVLVAEPVRVRGHRVARRAVLVAGRWAFSTHRHVVIMVMVMDIAIGRIKEY